MIKRITIEMEDGKLLELSQEEARQLYNELRGLFGVTPSIPYYPLQPYQPYNPSPFWYGDTSISPSPTTTTYGLTS